MSLKELLPAVQSLPRDDKYRLILELLADLAREEGLAPGEYPVWSPYEAHDAAATLMEMLRADEAKAA